MYLFNDEHINVHLYVLINMLSIAIISIDIVHLSR